MFHRLSEGGHMVGQHRGKKEAKADVRESWHHGEERLEDKNRDINFL